MKRKLSVSRLKLRSLSHSLQLVIRSGYLSRLNSLKTQNPSLKIIAAVGGYNENLVPVWSSMAANANYRENFALNVLSFLKKTNLDGIGESTTSAKVFFYYSSRFCFIFKDIGECCKGRKVQWDSINFSSDWEYPNFYGGARSEVDDFIELLKKLKQTLGSVYSVSIAIGAGDWRTGLSYNIPKVFDNCDFVNLMSYDLHGGWESKTGIHAGLYRSSLDPTNANVDYCVNLLLRQGVSRDKLIMGIPAYGNSFRLANATNNMVVSWIILKG